MSGNLAEGIVPILQPIYVAYQCHDAAITARHVCNLAKMDKNLTTARTLFCCNRPSNVDQVFG